MYFNLLIITRNSLIRFPIISFRPQFATFTEIRKIGRVLDNIFSKFAAFYGSRKSEGMKIHPHPTNFIRGLFQNSLNYWSSTVTIKTNLPIQAEMKSLYDSMISKSLHSGRILDDIKVDFVEKSVSTVDRKYRDADGSDFFRIMLEV